MSTVSIVCLALGFSPAATPPRVSVEGPTRQVCLSARQLLPDKKENEDKEKKRKPKFTVGKETTFVTGPLDKEGYIDYAAALNARMGKGITPKTNANVLLWKAFGPHPEGFSTMHPEFFQLLGCEPPPERGDYFLGLSRYMREHLKLKPGEESNTVLEQLDRAMERAWTAKQFPHIAGWLKVNEKPLALIVEATRRPAYFNPLIPRKSARGPHGLPSANWPVVIASREAAIALAARGLLRTGEGRTDEAWQDLLACHRLGRLLGRGSLLIEALVGIAIDAVASKADVAFLDCVRLTAKQAQGCLRDLQQLPPLPSIADKYGLAERFFVLDVVQLTHRYGVECLDDPLYKPPEKADPKKLQAFRNIDWSPVLRKANQYYDRAATAMRRTDRADRAKELEALDKEVSRLRKESETAGSLGELLLKNPNPDEATGKVSNDILLGMLLPDFSRMQQSADRSEQIQRNLHLAFALAAYRHDHGAYPKQLADLAPKYLSQLPNDLFSGKALIYRPAENGYLLYSVGPNGKDDGGRWYDDDPPGDDPRIRLPLPELKPTE